jgi:hypothetical protein
MLGLGVQRPWEAMPFRAFEPLILGGRLTVPGSTGSYSVDEASEPTSKPT